MADLRNYKDVPRDVKNFLSYLSNIKGKSDNTINEYYYDLRTFFRFMKCHRLLASYNDFDIIDCSDIAIDFIREIQLEDLYEYLMYANSDRENNANARARKVSSLKSFFNYMSSKAHLLDINITKDSFVYDVFKSEEATINSYHCYEIDRLAPALSVVATSPDGVIEAAENKERRIFATQWHPELTLAQENSVEHKFFENFFKCCAEK